MDISLLSQSLLAGLLLVATVCDWRWRRIPNALITVGMLMGLALQHFSTAGQGLFLGGGLGALAALLGGLTGLALFLPAYALRMMGAGDVKLLAMLGVWLGWRAVIDAAVWSLLAGGLLALAVAACSIARHRASGPNALSTAGSINGATPLQTIGKGVQLPYAVAIAAGTGIALARLMWSSTS